jgi:site-specific DNA-methyltransferase (adenine-specific)
MPYENRDGLWKSPQQIAFNAKNTMDGLILLSSLREETIATCFFDPQYRGLLDKLNYGNEGVRQRGRVNLSQMSEDTIVQFITEISRVLKPSGYVFLWIDKYHLLEQSVKQWVGGTELLVVDMITWDKQKIGMGFRSRRRSEYVVVLQKEPIKAKAVWSRRDIPDVWNEKVPSDTRYPHRKPIQLQQALILATTKRGDLVVDPAAGSYSVFEACQEVGRDFLGCDVLE